MTWHATDVLDDAYSATKALLLPFSIARWVVLAVVVFFVGSASSFAGTVNTPPNVSTLPDFTIDIGNGLQPIGADPTAFLAPALAVIVLGAIVFLGLIVFVVAQIMQFVFVRQLTEREVRIRGYFGESLGPGVRLLAFWIALAIGLVLLLIAMLFLTIVTFGLFILLLIPLFILGGVGLWILFRFTIDFVVPIMLVDEVGVLDAWRRLADELRVEWRQYGLYALVRFGLELAGGIAITAAGFVILLVLGIPAAIIGFALYLALAWVSSTLALVVVGALALLVFLAVVALTTVLVGVPVETYLRYYALYVLARVSPEYDMLDAVRAAVDEAAESS